jgi:hexosaminidase
MRYNASTYDPRKEETYAIILPIIDEVITLIRPRAIHIGHDEAAGHSLESGEKWLRPGETMLPKELFLMDVLRHHNYLVERGVETWM